MRECLLVLSDSATAWTAAHQAPLFIECSRQEYWSGLPFPSPGDLSNPGIEPTSPTLEVDSLPPESPGKYERGVLIIQQSDIRRTRTKTNWKGAKKQQKFNSTPGVYTSTLKVRIWKIPCKSQCIERLLLYQKIRGFLASSREEFNLGPVMRLDRSELLCNKVLLKFKRDRESFW